MKKHYLSVLRILATLAVVFLHTNNTLTKNYQDFQVSNSDYTLFSLGTTLMMWAVPFFFMITGELLLDDKKIITISDVIKKYIKRILIALFMFGIPFSILEMISEEKSFKFAFLYRAILNVINGESWSHLWYLYAVIGVYLLLPLMKLMVQKADPKLINYMIVILYLFNCIFPFINILFSTRIAFVFPIAGYSILYLLVGWKLDRIEYSSKLIKISWGVLALTGIANIVLCIIYEKDFLDVVGYNSPVIVLNSVALFILLKNYIKKINLSEKNASRLWGIDRLCFGVYLVHPFYINLLYKFVDVSPMDFSFKLIAVIVFAILFSIISFVTSFILRLIKPIKKYVL